ncbi:hypothetical protein M901_0433 [Bacteriovorax sp. DB6_IX]|nr:hypothetical protein M901_0433 [Bacteriovorax sp. DB6_IX]
MTRCIICVILFSSALAYTGASNIQEAIITDPSISRRCESLVDNRRRKVKHRQRLTYLNERNKKLQKATPVAKKSIRQKLIENQKSIFKELRLTNLRIQDIEESIIRRGCPGISL